MKKNKRQLIPFAVIEQATKGDSSAIYKIVRHYRGYIISLSRSEYVRREVEDELISGILAFKIR